MGASSRELLTIACGNSTIRCVRHADGSAWSTSSSDPDVAALTAFVRERHCQGAVAVSVVPAALAAVRRAVSAAGIGLAVVGDQLACPMPLAYATKETLGADRWLGAYAAHRRFGAAVTVDCGTATTINVVDAGGTFRGGAIAPGLVMFAAGLARSAPALPPVDLDARPVMPASSTQDSVDAGVLLGYAGLVERLVVDAQRSLAVPSCIVVTGGNAARLLRSSGLPAEHAPELLHDGMLMLADIAQCGC